MEPAFFIAAIIALATSIRTITCSHPVHALLYLIVSLLALAVDFYVLGAQFAATLEVIVYAGAIMVLFIFVVMMLNLNQDTVKRERRWLEPTYWIGPGICAGILFVAMAWSMIAGGAVGNIEGNPLSSKAIGSLIFGPYVLASELAAFLLLSALVVAGHIGRDDPKERHRRTEPSNAPADNGEQS